MAKYVYTMRRVSKTVPPQRAILKNISLNFFPGAKIGVLGLNGSGKSTLLKIMAGVDDGYEGEVIRMPGIQVGFLPQEPLLDAAKTVRETVEQGGLQTARLGRGHVFSVGRFERGGFAPYRRGNGQQGRILGGGVGLGHGRRSSASTRTHAYANNSRRAIKHT